MLCIRANCSGHDGVRQCNQREQTMRKNREGGQREILEKDMAKWKKNENLQEINLNHREKKVRSQDIFFRVIVSQLGDASGFGEE